MPEKPRTLVRGVVTELVPWAMLPKGPMWIKAGFPSAVCTRLGRKACRKRAAMAPTAPRSWA